MKDTEMTSSPLVELEKKEVRSAKRKVVNFKDDEFYISAVPTNQHLEAGLSVKNDEGFGTNRLDAAVLDLVADDSSGLQKQKSQFHWDKRSKKYIKLNNGDRVTASGKIKNESGSKIKSDKTGLYKKWKERSHRKISLGGIDADEATGPTERGNKLPQQQHFKGGRKRWTVPNANVPSELNDPEHVRKMRQKKTTKIMHLKSKSFKGGKGKGKGKANGKGKKFGKKKAR